MIFFHNSNLTKQDKDVKDLPEQKAEEEQQGTVRQFRGKVAIVIDDCGYDMAPVRKLLNTGLPFSYAILPYKQYSSDVLEMVKAKGRVPMLHLPMEPIDRSAMSEGAATIRTDLSATEKLSLTRRALNSLPGVMGVNNHQGSKATADKDTMRVVLQELRRQNLFFVDSRTNSASVARNMAQQLGVSTARNDIFWITALTCRRFVSRYIRLSLWRKETVVLLLSVMPDRILPNAGRCMRRSLNGRG